MFKNIDEKLEEQNEVKNNDIYILVEASKGSYDAPIEINIIKKSNNISDLIEEILKFVYIQKLIENDYEILRDAIKNKNKYAYYDKYNHVYLEYDDKNNFIYYSTGCPSDNEYDGSSYKILKI